jgi:hypothetical protein
MALKKRAAYDFRDGYHTITPDAGPYAGKSLHVRSGEKLTIDPGAKASHTKSFKELPIFIARGSAEPKMTVDGMLERDIATIREFIGGIGGSAFTFTSVWTRPGQPTRKIEVKGCEISGGMGLGADENGLKDKLDALCMDILEDGVSIYAKRHR